MWEKLKRLFRGEDVNFEWEVEFGFVDILFMLVLLVLIIGFLISL